MIAQNGTLIQSSKKARTLPRKP